MSLGFSVDTLLPKARGGDRRGAPDYAASLIAYAQRNAA
jgi:hypothetical protein